MGYYINPSDGSSKEEWLKKNGKNISTSQVFSCDFDINLPVCLINNGMFTAAGIGFDKREAQVFLEPDGRKKIWYEVSKELLKEFM